MPLPKDFQRAMSGKTRKRILANRYQIEKKLGSGNFGTASLVKDLKAKDPKEESKVLKEIHVGDLQPDETVDAMHEANLLRHLDHPGIVKFHDSFIENENFCIVTEYCEGGDLDAKVAQCKKQKKKIAEPMVIEWLIQLLLAVQYMHSRRVLHRDLKARNIFIRNNMIKIGDFGISRILMGTSDMASTFTGTPYYMSPEVLKHEGYNSKSDVWSVGCILYEMVALTHAFEGQSLMGVMYKIVESNLPDWPQGYSKELEEVFHFIMNKDPSKRPSASEVLKHPFIAKSMELMKETLVSKHKSRQNDDSIIEIEANRIANVLREKSYLEDLQKQEAERRLKYMSPREKMILRKKQRADEEAERLRLAARVQLDKNREIFEANKQTMNAYKKQDAPWLKQEKPTKKKEETDFTIGVRPFTAPMPYIEVEHDDDDDIEFGNGPVPRLSHTLASTVPCDERPITPMKDRMVYSLTTNSLDFKDGIPDRPDLAETYYSQFEDDFEDEGKPKRGQQSDDLEDESGSESEDEYEGTLVNTVQAAGMEGEVEDLITCMQNALDKSDTIKSQTLMDNTVQDAFGPTVKEIKIKNLRSECIRKLGEVEFEKAYEYLKAARFGDNNSMTDEGEMMRELRKIVKNTNDCFLVDQLLFLEEQSKMING